MAAWTFRVRGMVAPLSRAEQSEVQTEMARVQSLVEALPGAALVRKRRNPSGMLGDYVALLLDAVARGIPLETVVPPPTCQQYGQRRWFRASVEVLDAFTEELGDRRIRTE